MSGPAEDGMQLLGWVLYFFPLLNNKLIMARMRLNASYSQVTETQDQDKVLWMKIKHRMIDLYLGSRWTSTITSQEILNFDKIFYLPFLHIKNYCGVSQLENTRREFHIPDGIQWILHLYANGRAVCQSLSHLFSGLISYITQRKQELPGKDKNSHTCISSM